MKKLISLLLIIGILPLLMTSGCKKEKETTDFDLMTDYVSANSLDLTDILDGWVTSGGGININTVDFSVPDYYIMDFRSQTDFDLGHIKDAHNVTFGDVLTEASKANGKTILCVCYTGQTAARATGFLKMAGFSAKSLKWGMSAWHNNFEGKWEANAKDVVSDNWETSGTPQAITVFSDPDFSTGKATGQEIFESRINTALAFDWAVSSTDVLANPDNYFINNKWPLASWDEYGHLKGSYRLDEDLHLEGLENLNPDETLVTYCYTGQTSSITTAWLQVMGFDGARSMLFGANSIVHSNLLVGSAGSAPAKSWKGPSSGSILNYGYYDASGNYYSPL